MYIRWNQNQLTRPKCHRNPKNNNNKNNETIDANAYIIFNTHKIPKEIKIGYQKINVEPYSPNHLRCYKCQVWAPPGPMYTTTSMWRIWCYNSQKDYKRANCQENHGAGSRDCEVWKKKKKITKLKHTQNSTYPEARRMVEITKYVKETKNIPTTKKQSCHMRETSATTKAEVVAQLVNEMRALIQIKTIIEAVWEKLSKDPNTRVATSQERQTKPDRKSSRVLTSEVTSVAGPLETPPKRKTKGNPLPDGQEHGTK